MKERNAHRQVSGTHAHTSEEAGPTARSWVCDGGSVLTHASQLEVSVGSYQPVSTCELLAEHSGSSAPLTLLYMQSL